MQSICLIPFAKNGTSVAMWVWEFECSISKKLYKGPDPKKVWAFCFLTKFFDILVALGEVAQMVSLRWTKKSIDMGLSLSFPTIVGSSRGRTSPFEGDYGGSNPSPTTMVLWCNG